MECRNCGCKYNDSSNFCASCDSYSNRSYGNYRSHYKANPAVTALIFGVLGLAICILNFIVSPFLHLIGLGLGIIAVILGKRGTVENAPLSIGAMMTGIIAVILSIIGIKLGYKI